MIESVLSLLKSLIKPLSEMLKSWFIYRAGRKAERLESTENAIEKVKVKNEIKNTFGILNRDGINRVLQKYFRDK